MTLGLGAAVAAEEPTDELVGPGGQEAGTAVAWTWEAVMTTAWALGPGTRAATWALELELGLQHGLCELGPEP